MAPDGKVAMHANPAIASAIPGSALDDLNWMRGLAAIAVLAGHIRGPFFVELGSKSSLLARAVYLVTGFGHQAVIVFFVLSGFFIGTSVVATSRDDTWSWKRFALRRMTRLYVVLLPALVLTAIWDSLGTSLFGLQGIYTNSINAPVLSLPDLRKSFNLPVFLGNVAFLQDFRVLPFGSNGPLWSLSYEFWAYVTFPLLYRATRPGAQAPLRIASAVLGACIIAILGGQFPFYFSVWALGAVVAIGWSYRPVSLKTPLLGTAATMLFTMALLAARAHALHRRQLEDFALGAATALFVASRLALATPREETEDRLSRIYSRWGDVLASFSYTLYAAHFPAVAFFQTWFVGDQRWTPDLARIVAAVTLGLCLIVFYAYPLSRLTEARTDDVRKWLERRALRVARPA